jgi:hypothetical protein
MSDSDWKVFIEKRNKTCGLQGILYDHNQICEFTWFATQWLDTAIRVKGKALGAFQLKKLLF